MSSCSALGNALFSLEPSGLQGEASMSVFFPPTVSVYRKNNSGNVYRFQLQQNLLVHPLIQEQLPHFVDHIIDHRLVQFRLRRDERVRKPTFSTNSKIFGSLFHSLC